MIKGLAPHTQEIFERISRLECLTPFVLVGGTALSLQIETRKSEDLDFMRWRTSKDDKLDIGWPNIEKELREVGDIENVEVLGFDQVIFIVSKVKISFYAAPRKRIPTMIEIPFLNNIRLADINSIGVMKMEAMMRRNTFRDYYDIYSILKNGTDVFQLIKDATAHSQHKLKTKNLLSILTNGDYFKRDEDFLQLEPIYNVTSGDIQEYIKGKLKKT